MKEIDVSQCELVFAGEQWNHPRQPCCKEMIPLLERKESYCSWFQPKGGSVEDQFPAMRIKKKYYQLSLRVQKAIFRHIRLRKGFVNIEHVPDGRAKLRIPKPLLLEKRRTATRFMVKSRASSRVIYSYSLRLPFHIHNTDSSKCVNRPCAPARSARGRWWTPVKAKQTETRRRFNCRRMRSSSTTSCRVLLSSGNNEHGMATRSTTL